jgi:hypothetical protein
MNFLTETEPLGCGVDTHDIDCLCDVRIETTTPINIKCLVKDMKYGLEICEIKDYCEPWDDKQIINYMSDLVYAHDEMGKWAGVLEHYDKSSREVDTIGRAVSDWKSIRQTAEKLLSSPNRPKVRQVLMVMGITAEQFIGAVTTHKFKMDADTLDEFERVILDGKPKIYATAKQFGMSYEIARNLITYWGILPKINRKPRIKK